MSRMQVQLILVAGLLVLVAFIMALRNEPVAFVNTEQQYQEDTCVPEHSGVLSLAVQRVNHIVAPECKDTF